MPRNYCRATNSINGSAHPEVLWMRLLKILLGTLLVASSAAYSSDADERKVQPPEGLCGFGVSGCAPNEWRPVADVGRWTAPTC